MKARFWTLVARIRASLQSGDLDRDFGRELETHLDMAAEDKVRGGMTPEQARRAARIELGGVTQVREAGRAMRGLSWPGTLGLDVTLALRLLRKSWGLTLAGGLAMTTAIAIVVGLLNTYERVYRGSLPFPDADRIVVLMERNATANRRAPVPLRDFARWRDTLRSVEDVGAFRTTERAVAAGEEAGDPMSVAEMTASGFTLPRVPPLLGRPILEADEREGASPVVVIGERMWRTRLASDPDVTGRQLRLDGIDHTVVGVMPEGFAFPVNHQLWTPLRTPPEGGDPGEGPTVFGFGRLVAGVTLEEAQAELTATGLLPSLAPASDAGDRRVPRVLPYTFGLTSGTEGLGRAFALRFMLIAALLFFPPCANVAILVYARTVSRHEELSARCALGATRGRLIGQLFIEVLVLAIGAAIVALAFVRLVGRWLETGINLPNGIGIPFWMDFGAIAPRTAFLAGALALLAALTAGALPALQATSRLVPAGLRATGNGPGARLGVIWTGLIVAQVAISIAVLPPTIELAWGTLRPRILGPGFPAEQFLAARLVLDRASSAILRPRDGAPVSPGPLAFDGLRTALMRRLVGEPDVSAVTASSAVPGRGAEAYIEVDRTGDAGSDTANRRSSRLVRRNEVDDTFFDVFGVPLLSGRALAPGDESVGAVLVNRTFAQQVLGPGNPLGRRFRYTGGGIEAPAPGPWHEIVGVVADFPANMDARRVYHRLTSSVGEAATIVLQVGRDPTDRTRRLRELAAAVDPALRVEEVQGLDRIYEDQQVLYVAGLMIGGVTASVLLLSAAGIYALMSFTVTRRRREIGIRAALGARPHLLLAGVFRGALGQLGAGAVLGMAVALVLDRVLPVIEIGGRSVPGILPAAASLMVVVGLLAALGPARRAIGIDPTEALRGERQ